MTNKAELSPEGAKIALAVAKGLGIDGNSVAPNVRVREGFKPSAAPEKREWLPCPILAIDADAILRPTELDDLVGVRLGVAITVNEAGVIGLWSIVVRRNGEKLCQLDYDDEETCEEELETLRKEIDDWLTGGYPFEIFTKAIGITNFNPATGQSL